FSIVSTTKGDIGVWMTSSSSMAAARAPTGASVTSIARNATARDRAVTGAYSLPPVRSENAVGFGLRVPHRLGRRLGPGQRGLEAVVERLDHALVVVGGQLGHRVLELVAGDGCGGGRPPPSSPCWGR